MIAPRVPGQTRPEPTSRRAGRRSRALLALGLIMAMCTLALGCSPATQTTNDDGYATENFEFVRSKLGIVRLDSRNGQAWGVPLNGDGGWEAIGGPVDIGSDPPTRGRFSVLAIAQRPNTINIGGEPAIMLRVDRQTGDSWLLESTASKSWTPIVERDAGPAASSSAVPAQPTAAAAEPGGGKGDFPILKGDALGTTPEERAQTRETLHNALAKEGMPQKMRVWAVRQLGELDPDVATPELLLVLDDSDGVVVAEAVRQLGRIGKPSTLPALIRLQNHPDQQVRDAVGEVVVAK